jgi:hypothetical protein
MANDFDSNITRQLARIFLEKFETNRILSKNVNTQLLSGRFNPSTGDTVDFKRSTDYITQRSADGDISATTASSIITGKASGVVQDMFTVEVDFNSVDEALKMDQLDELLSPMATRIVTDMELDFAQFMMENSGLQAGSFGTAVTTWDHVAEAGAVLQATGVPMDDMWTYAVNPFTQRKLASDQRSLGGETGAMTANQRATITENFAGMKVMTANTLASFTTGTGADRVGAVNGAPTSTYLAAKDTMTQSITVDGFQANLEIKAGEVVEVTAAAGAVNRLNLSTRKPIIDETGANVLWTGTVTADVTLDGTGAGTIVVTGPAIFEANGQYNTVSQVIADNDVITLKGAADTLYQPNLFWHKQAFAIGSVPLPKLRGTDTVATTEDGIQIRVSKDSSIRENKNIVRFDLLPAYGVMNPFFAGQGWGL